MGELANSEIMWTRGSGSEAIGERPRKGLRELSLVTEPRRDNVRYSLYADVRVFDARS
jgi:hypothetical protein